MPRPRPPAENDLLLAIRQFGRATERRPAGDGWWTLDELATQEGVSRAMMRYRLEMAQRNGVTVEMMTGSVVDDEGRAKRATFYRLRKNGKP